jgi:hypothetical protein
MFRCSFGPAGCKQPDAHWTMNQRRLPISPPPGTFAVGAAGKSAPQLVLEVAVSHESIPVFTERDLQRYFAEGTGTRWWIVLKIRGEQRDGGQVTRNGPCKMASSSIPQVSIPNACPLYNLTNPCLYNPIPSTSPFPQPSSFISEWQV